MSEAPQLPTPSPRHSRFAKSDDGVSSQRDVREKLSSKLVRCRRSSATSTCTEQHRRGCSRRSANGVR
jgi:hypothetical protein